ncbi:MAG: class II fructose-bisphosphate aldolase [Spirochaetia bacterium]
MPFADFDTFSHMTDTARRRGFAFPAFNVHDLYTLNGVIEGFASAESDGIVQIYPDAAREASGAAGDPVLGAVTLADHAHRLAEKYGVYIAVHSDHCDADLAPVFLGPLIEVTADRRSRGMPNLFTSHMLDGSSLPLSVNLDISSKYLELCRKNDLWLEIEIGIVGAESGTGNSAGGEQARVYTSPDDFLAVAGRLGTGKGLLVAPSFGNVHGVYKPGEVVLEPEVLGRCQAAVPEPDELKLVFHGGSGSRKEDIMRSIGYGVVKMNFDTDGQYAFTRGVADYMFKNYDKILRLDGDMGIKLAYFAETWLSRGRESIKDIVRETCALLGSAGNSVY